MQARLKNETFMLILKILRQKTILFFKDIFWVNLFFTLLCLLVLQIIVHFGSKFALFPISVEDYFRDVYYSEYTTGYNVFWRIPLRDELLIYLGIFFLVFWITSKFKNIKNEKKKYNITDYVFITFRMFILFYMYLQIQDPAVARNIFFKNFSVKYSENFVIDCVNSKIKFASFETKRESVLCNWCYQEKMDKNINCKFKGLDSFEPLMD